MNINKTEYSASDCWFDIQRNCMVMALQHHCSWQDVGVPLKNAAGLAWTRLWRRRGRGRAPQSSPDYCWRLVQSHSFLIDKHQHVAACQLYHFWVHHNMIVSMACLLDLIGGWSQLTPFQWLTYIYSYINTCILVITKIRREHSDENLTRLTQTSFRFSG